MEYKIGMVLKGTVTGIQPYGAFVSLDKETQGLIHISECTQGFVKDLHSFLKIGEELDVKILDIDEYTKKISLSIRALEDDQNYHEELAKKRFKRKRAPKIGFYSIAEMLPVWIEEAKEDEEKRKQSQNS